MPLRSAHSKTTGTSRPAPRSAASARTAVLDMLKADHKRVKKAFRDFEKLDPHADAEECAELVARTCTELEVHAQLEEDLFYPAARDGMEKEDLIAEAEVEHKSAKMLIADLKDLSPEDEKFAATFTVLGEYVNHHVREEEQEMFKEVERARIDWAGLLEAMEGHREELAAQLGLDEEGSDQAMPTAGARKSSSRSGRV